MPAVDASKAMTYLQDTGGVSTSYGPKKWGWPLYTLTTYFFLFLDVLTWCQTSPTSNDFAQDGCICWMNLWYLQSSKDWFVWVELGIFHNEHVRLETYPWNRLKFSTVHIYAYIIYNIYIYIYVAIRLIQRDGQERFNSCDWARAQWMLLAPQMTYIYHYLSKIKITSTSNIETKSRCLMMFTCPAIKSETNKIPTWNWNFNHRPCFLHLKDRTSAAPATATSAIRPISASRRRFRPVGWGHEKQRQGACLHQPDGGQWRDQTESRDFPSDVTRSCFF